MKFLKTLSGLRKSRSAINRIKRAARERATALDLRESQLSALPAEIGQLTNLQSLDLSHNQLRELPTKIGQLTNLEWLDLAGNYRSNRTKVHKVS